MYPNPANGSVFISVPGSDHYVLEVYSQNGSLVLNQLVSEMNFELNMEAFTKGLYFLKISDEKSVVFKKVVLN